MSFFAKVYRSPRLDFGVYWQASTHTTHKYGKWGLGCQKVGWGCVRNNARLCGSIACEICVTYLTHQYLILRCKCSSTIWCPYFLPTCQMCWVFFRGKMWLEIGCRPTWQQTEIGWGAYSWKKIALWLLNDFRSPRINKQKQKNIWSEI